MSNVNNFFFMCLGCKIDDCRNFEDIVRCGEWSGFAMI